MTPVSQALESFQQTISQLRSKDGCPWIKSQDHLSLRKFLLEETYEVLHEINEQRYDSSLCHELGDLLLQVVLHAHIASENNRFTLKDVIESIEHKMRHRNPHVFEKKQKLTIEEVHQQWEKIKMEEQHFNTSKIKNSLQKISSYGPATLQAEKIGDKAKELNFDWSHVNQVIDKLQEELNEVKDALQTGNMKHTQEEIGDLYFTIAQVCRHLNFDPEDTAKKGNIKFLKRFQKLQELAEKANINLKHSTQSELETFWLEAKKQETQH
ncbi:MAG: nucleoside triphosphate pyrophosphohydrolase [Oligoflexales bacterium]